MRIRTRLLVLALSILLPASFAAACAIWFVYSEQKEAQARSMAEAAQALALLVDSELAAVEGRLHTLALSPHLQQGDLALFTRHAKQVAPGSDRAVVLSSLDGQQIVNTRAPNGHPLPRINSGLLALRHAAPTHTVISDLYVGAVAKRQDVAVDVPVFVDSRLRYRLSMGLGAETFQKLVEHGAPDSWLVTVIDRAGTVVARSRDPHRFVGQRASATMLKRVLNREAYGINDGTTLDGHRVNGFFHRAPRSGWTVVFSIPVDDMQRPARQAAIVLAAVIVTLLGTSVIVARRYAYKTARPIERLREAADQLGRGEYVQVESTGLVETDLVGQALSRASEQVRHHQAELEQRVREAVATAERSQRALLQNQKLEALGRLTGGIAHDFNNILQTLTSALQLIQLSSDPARIRKLAETCDKAIGRATALTAQLRSFGRVQDVRLETVSPPDALATVLPLLVNTLPTNITVRTEVADDAWAVTIDRLQFELALLNVVINARDALPHGGEIRLGVHNLAGAPAGLAAGEWVVVEVSDNGTGMPPEVLAHALDPFFTTKPVDRGSGLGLAQAYGFATQAGGTLALASQLGKGTTVTIYLPRAGANVARPGPAASSGVWAQGSGTVLFVEDDALVRETVAPALALAGFEVIEADSADAALAILDAGRAVQVVFSDVVMPGQLNGVELARIVRERYPDTRVVLASGHTDIRINLPEVQLLGKPYDVQRLIEVLVSGEPPAQRPAAVTAP